MRYSDAVYAFLVATAVALLLTPVAARLAWKIKATAKPNERGLAVRETPLLGGLAILAGVVVAAAIWLPDQIILQHVAHGRPGPGGTVDTWGVIAGAGVITLVGAIDDWIDLPAAVKLLGQIGAAIIAVRAGAVVLDVTLPFLGALQFPSTGGVLTVIWLVALMNIVNFSDGVDGLAAGLCTIDGIAFTVIAFALGVKQRGDPRRDHGRRGARIPVSQLLSGERLHGRRGREPARLPARDRHRARLAEDERGRRPGGAARDPRRAVPRHELRCREADQVPPGAVERRRKPLPPPDGADRLQPAADGGVPVRLDR